MIKIIFLKRIGFILSILVFNTLFGQNNYLSLEHYAVKDGLPSSQVYDCSRDQDGFLWIGTDAGVSRFDGKSFKNYGATDGLGDNEVLSIYNDSKGRVWFIPFGGKLSYFHSGQFYLKEIPAIEQTQLNTTHNFYMMAEDKKGNLFFAKSKAKRVVRLSSKDNKEHVFDLSPFIKSYYGIAAFLASDSGTMLCITYDKRLLELKEDVIEDITPPFFLEKEDPKRFYATHKRYCNYLMFLGKEGIYHLTGNKASLIIPNEKMESYNFVDVLDIRYDNFKNIFLTHIRKGLQFFRYTGHNYSEGSYIFNNLPALTYCDTDNNIWFRTSEGLYKGNYLQLGDEKALRMNQNLLSKKIISCTIDRFGGIWLGYDNGNLSRFTKSEVKHYHVGDSFKKNNRVVCLEKDAKDNILVGTDENILVLKHLGEGTYSEPIKLEKSADTPLAVKNIFFNAQGNAFFSISSTVDLYQLDLNTLTYTRIRNPDWSPRPPRHYSSFFDRNNCLYVSLRDGLHTWFNNKTVWLSSKEPRLNLRVQDYVQAKDGTIFLATYNSGLVAMKDMKYVSAITKLKGKDVICRKIYLKGDTLYLATNIGVGVLLFEKEVFKQIRLISFNDGLLSDDVNDLVFEGNSIYAATSEGMSLIKAPLEDVANMKAPNLMLQSFKADDSLYNIKKAILLPHQTRLIRVSYVAPVMDKSGLTLYRYRFTASDKWVQTSANFIEFSRLKSGDYEIELQAKRYTSKWSSSQRIRFSIAPPFYAATWFITSLVLLTAIGLLLILYNFLNRKPRLQDIALEQKQAIERERNRIAADIHDDIGSELTNIAILSEVLKQSTLSDTEKSLKLASKIQSSSNNVIAKMNEVIWTLNESDDTLSNLMAYIRSYINTLSVTHPMEIKLHIDSTTLIPLSLGSVERRHIFLVIKELLQNALKHSKAKDISVSIELLLEKTLRISYSDNGIGFDTSKVTEGNGLKNINRRINENEGGIKITSELKKGTHVEVLFPVISLKENYE
jgi:signal transduction histidine kinase